MKRPGAVQGVYENVVKKYMRQGGLLGELFAAHALRATAATNALTDDADIAKVKKWLGHANIQTARIYDRRKTRPEDSSTFRVRYWAKRPQISLRPFPVTP